MEQPAFEELDGDIGVDGAISLIRELQAYHGDVWHYTDAGGLAGIVSAGELWASSAILLNDPQELKFGARRIREWYQQEGNAASGDPSLHIVLWEHLKDLHETIVLNPAYVVCASEELLLSQWRNYAGSSGYAVRLDAGMSYGIVDDGTFGDDRVASAPRGVLTKLPAWTRIAYTIPEQDRLIAKVFDFLLRRGGMVSRLHRTGNTRGVVIVVHAYINALAASMKHHEYREEREVRMIVNLPSRRHPQHRPTARGVVPYVRVMATEARLPGRPQRFAPLPIREVRVGPPEGETEVQRLAGVRSLLAAHDYEAVPVDGSGIPFLP